MITPNQPKKIIFAITKDNWGGAQRYVYDLATAPSTREHYEVIVATGPAPASAQTTLSGKLRAAGLRVETIGRLERDIKVGGDFLAAWLLWRFFRAERPAIVHLNSSKIAGLGALGARLAGVPKIVFTVHGWPFMEDRPWWQRVTIKFLSWLSALLATDVIVLGKAEWLASARWPGIARKLRLVRHGLEPARLLGREVARTELLAAIHCPRDFFDRKTIIGSVGELHRNKGYRYALNALAENPHRQKLIYLIVGSGEERQSLEHQIDALGLRGNVFLIGFLPDAGRYLPALDLFLLPSVKEGLPYVLLEAGAAGLPVVATRVGNIAELIEDRVNGRLVPPRSPAALGAALNDLTANPSAARRLGDNLAATIKNHYQWGEMVNKTLAIYEQGL